MGERYDARWPGRPSAMALTLMYPDEAALVRRIRDVEDEARVLHEELMRRRMADGHLASSHPDTWVMGPSTRGERNG